MTQNTSAQTKWTGVLRFAAYLVASASLIFNVILIRECNRLSGERNTAAKNAHRWSEVAEQRRITIGRLTADVRRAQPVTFDNQRELLNQAELQTQILRNIEFDNRMQNSFRH